MQVPEELEIIHQPARLALMALLFRQGDIGAGAAREATGLTPGNLDSHAKRLADANLVVGRKALTRDGFEVRYRLTDAGLAAFQEYLAWLEQFAKVLRTTPQTIAE